MIEILHFESILTELRNQSEISVCVQEDVVMEAYKVQLDFQDQLVPQDRQDHLEQLDQDQGMLCTLDEVKRHVQEVPPDCMKVG